MKVRTKDPKNPSCTLVQEVPNPPDRSGRVIMKCSKCSKPMSFPAKVAATIDPDKLICKQCREQEVKSRTYITCKDCGKKFYIKKEKVDFLNSLGYTLPVRCFSCHQNKKDK